MVVVMVRILGAWRRSRNISIGRQRTLSGKELLGERRRRWYSRFLLDSFEWLEKLDILLLRWVQMRAGWSSECEFHVCVGLHTFRHVQQETYGYLSNASNTSTRWIWYCPQWTSHGQLEATILSLFSGAFSLGPFCDVTNKHVYSILRSHLFGEKRACWEREEISVCFQKWLWRRDVRSM